MDPTEQLASTPSAPSPAGRIAAVSCEAFAYLHERAKGHTGSIPTDVIVRHLLRVTHDADWSVKRDALEAVLRRLGFAKRDGLVARATTRQRGLGRYRTERPGSKGRPYSTWLMQLDPLQVSCDCPDFVRGSLGVCKHALTVLQDVYTSPGRARAASDAPNPFARESRIAFDPIRPLTGAGDGLARIHLVPGTGGLVPYAVAARFRTTRAGAVGWVKQTYPDQLERRRDLVRDLLALPETVSGIDIEPAAKAYLEIEHAELLRRISTAALLPRFAEALGELERPLYRYQREGVLRALAAGRLLLADDMGLGKTAQATAFCHALWISQTIQRGLIITPASLKSQWLREWRLFSAVPVEIVDGSAEDRAEQYRSTKSGFLIANYEQILKDLDVVQEWSPSAVVLDEAQRMKNWASKTAFHVKQLQPEYRLVLTGTPLENRLDELASLLDWVDDFALEPKWRLTAAHTTTVDGRKEIGGARHLDTLRERLAPCMLRRLRRDVLGQLPPRTDTIVTVPMTDEQAEEHDALIRPIAALLKIARRRPLTRAEFLRLMQLFMTQRVISNGLGQLRFEETWPRLEKLARPDPDTLRGLFAPKLLELREIVRQVAVTQERKIVVFSQWRRMLLLAHFAVKDVLEDHGVRASFFTGHESQARRTENLVAFHDDPSSRILFASDAGGVGLNLQRAASCCINLELPWNPAVLDQRIARIHRHGQQRPIDVYNLVNERGIESRIATLVDDKKALFKGLFDGASDEITFERSGSFLSRLERIVEIPTIDTKAQKRAASVTTEDAEDERAELADTLVVQADESQDRVSVETDPRRAEPGATAVDVAGLFSKLKITTNAQGSMTIEAPPSEAASLAAVFEGLARALRSGAAGNVPSHAAKASPTT
ncbi:MAG: DEAD/DEAH box helicase [Planctomycetes bacterium]|nr:DEAD/DEAH box helicase [Planctomycetota bacterium]MCC7170370.1 DEAD/DEAH box helicase [Planctomycetota bacterium]